MAGDAQALEVRGVALKGPVAAGSFDVIDVLRKDDAAHRSAVFAQWLSRELPRTKALPPHPALDEPPVRVVPAIGILVAHCSGPPSFLA